MESYLHSMFVAIPSRKTDPRWQRDYVLSEAKRSVQTKSQFVTRNCKCRRPTDLAGFASEFRHPHNKQFIPSHYARLTADKIPLGPPGITTHADASTARFKLVANALRIEGKTAIQYNVYWTSF